MRWCIALFTLMLLVLLSSMPARSQAAPTKPEAAEATEWQTLCGDISRSITDRVATLKAAGVKGYAEFDPTRIAAETAASIFDRLKRDTQKGDPRLPESAYALLRLALGALEVYRSVLADSRILTRLLAFDGASIVPAMFTLDYRFLMEREIEECLSCSGRV